MGSFTELSLALYFGADTSAEVLATFSSLRRPSDDDKGSSTAPAPDLPDFEPTPGDEWWVPDWPEAYGPDRVDPLADEPWRHDWASVFRANASVATVPDAALVWGAIEQWHFACRCSFKNHPEAVWNFLKWLGPHIQRSKQYHPATLVGVVKWDGARWPYLLFVQAGQLLMHSLNRPQDVYD